MAGRILSPYFVGRAEESARLKSLFKEAVAGSPGAVVISGDAGMGKTRLVQEFLAELSDDDAVAMVGGCIELTEGDLPYAPLTEALRSLLHGPAHEIVVETATTHPELARLIPELAPEGHGHPSDSGSARARLFSGFLVLLGELGKSAPVVLLVEDLHWADDSTRDLLAYVTHNLRDERVLVVLTYRSDELHRRHPLRQWLTALSNADVDRIDLRPLRKREIASQLEGAIGRRPDPGLLGSIYERAEGNPFFTEELLASSSEGLALPEGLQNVLLARFEAVDEGTRDYLRIASAAGRAVRHELLRAVGGGDESSLTQALRSAVDRRLLVPDAASESYSFRHSLLREAIYDELLPGERRDIHESYVRVLRADPQLGESSASAAELAYHCFAAKDLPAALAASVEAGMAAEQVYAHAEARKHYERAIGLWERVPNAESRSSLNRFALLQRAALVASLETDYHRALRFAEAAIEELDEKSQPEEAALLYQLSGRWTRWGLGDDITSRAKEERALALLRDQPPSRGKATVLANIALARGQATSHDAIALAEEAVEIAKAVGARREEGIAYCALGTSLLHDDHPEGVVEYLERALDIAREVNEMDDWGRAAVNITEVHARSGSFQKAAQMSLDLAEELKTLDFSYDRTHGDWLRMNAAEYMLPLGRWDEVESLTGDLIDSTRAGVRVGSLTMRCGLFIACGRFEEADRLLQMTKEAAKGFDQAQFVGPLLQCEAELALWRKDFVEAERLAREGVEKVEGGILWTGRLCSVAAWALVDRAALDDLPDAVGVMNELVASARSASSERIPESRAHLAQCEAELARLEHTEDAARAWSDCAKLWRDLAAPYGEAYARFREAEAYAFVRENEGAETALRRAHELASGLGAKPLLSEIEALAQRARIRLGAKEASGAHPHGLTAREVEVLRLVAHGKTNREIAGALFISPKTAGAHVSNILTKFGVSGRVEAAGLAHRLGIVDD